MKDIKTIAEQVKVSKTSIYNMLKKHGIETFRRDGKTFLDESAENQIIAYYSMEQQETLKDMINDTPPPSYDNIQANIQDNFQIENTEFISFVEKKLNTIDETIQAIKQDEKSISLLMDELQKKDEAIQASIHDKLRIEIEEKSELINVLKRQVDEQSKTIQSLIQVFNYDKQYQTAQLITENKKIMGEQSEAMNQSPPPEHNGFFRKLFKR